MCIVRMSVPATAVGLWLQGFVCPGAGKWRHRDPEASGRAD